MSQRAMLGAAMVKRGGAGLLMWVGFVVAWTTQILAATPTISDVMAHPCFSSNEFVDVFVTFSGASNDVAQAKCTFVATNTATMAALNVAHITAVAGATGGDTTWMRKFVWNAAADVGQVKIDDIALTAVLSAQVEGSGGVQLWEDGPYWAECNLGATSPEECGYYFYWGDTVGYSANTNGAVLSNGRWDNVTWVSSLQEVMTSSPFSYSSVPTSGWNPSDLLRRGYIDSTGELVTTNYDAARVYFDEPWRMPTSDEFADLIDKCDTTWTTCNGVYGRRVTGRDAYSSKSIFLPAAGYGIIKDLNDLSSFGGYWSSTLYPDSSHYSFCLGFDSKDFGLCVSHYRYYGQSIRPLRMSAQSPSGPTVSSSATTHLALDFREEPAMPVISPEDGTILTSARAVNISCTSQGATIRYTTDGSEPTLASEVYGRFKVSGKTTVKARAFYEDGRGGETSMARYALGQCPDPVIVSAGGTTFHGRDNVVSIDWSCVDGVVRYTTDGSDVTAESAAYAGPFTINATTVVKAKAFGVDYFDSAVVSLTITREWRIGDTMGAPDQDFTTGGDAEFFREKDTTMPMGEVMRSGAIENSADWGLYKQSTLSTVVKGPGVLKFKWRCSCEMDDKYEWDHAELAVDDRVVTRINGITGWQNVSQEITGAGEHVITWIYLKDEFGYEGEDCLRVADFSWTPAEPWTHESEVAVPYSWLREQFPDVIDEAAAYEALAQDTAANGLKVWECFVAGLNATAPESTLRASIEFKDGKVCLSWDPNLNTNEVTRIYKVWGRTDLDQGDWATPPKPVDRFFKVEVTMPTGADGETSAVSGEVFVPTASCLE